MEERLESLDIIINGIEEYLNLAETGLKLFKMTETFSMDGASNLESVRIALLNMRKLLSVLEIMVSKDTALLGGEQYCNLADFLRGIILEIKRISPSVADKIEFRDETFESMYRFNAQKMQILVYNITRIFIFGTMGQKIKLKLRLYETDKDFLMEFKGDAVLAEAPADLDRCMYYVLDKITESMNFKYKFTTQKSATKCTIIIPKQEDVTAIAREDTGKTEIDTKYAEIFFSDL